MISDVEQTIRDYLPWVLHMSLATCIDNKPRVCEVHFVYGDWLSFYFRSKESRRHSLEISKNPYVSANIVEQHAREDKPRWVYFEWTAKIVDSLDEIEEAAMLFHQRFDMETATIVDEAKSETGHKFYKISVSNFALFDKRESNPSHKHELQWG